MAASAASLTFRSAKIRTPCSKDCAPCCRACRSSSVSDLCVCPCAAMDRLNRYTQASSTDQQPQRLVVIGDVRIAPELQTKDRANRLSYALDRSSRRSTPTGVERGTHALSIHLRRTRLCFEMTATFAAARSLLGCHRIP